MHTFAPLAPAAPVAAAAECMRVRLMPTLAIGSEGSGMLAAVCGWAGSMLGNANAPRTAAEASGMGRTGSCVAMLGAGCGGAGSSTAAWRDAASHGEANAEENAECPAGSSCLTVVHVVGSSLGWNCSAKSPWDRQAR